MVYEDMVCVCVCVCLLAGIAGVTKWAWVGHGVSKTLQREIVSDRSEEDGTMKVIASRSHAGDVFAVAQTAFGQSKKVEKIVAAGAGYKALQVCLCVCIIKGSM